MNLKTLTAAFILILVACQTNKLKMQAQNIQRQDRMAEATFGGGCFWCTEAVFDRLEGVISVESGYAGGKVENPTYEAVCAGTTGHAEVIRIVYNPSKIAFEFLLEVFFNTHDPTTLNRQGNDIGDQYRSVVFYHNDEQKEIAEKMIQEFNSKNIYGKKVVTVVDPLTNYYKAENYHQEYFENNPQNGYCNVVVGPKVAKFEKKYQEHLKPEFKH
jgi:peptide-methionine (S)-S-oxide reductase